jgi:acetoacetyl-CoA synthetase
VTFFGAGAAFFANCLKAGVDLSTCGDLSRVRALGTTGSPLSPEAQQWGTAQFGPAIRKPGNTEAKPQRAKISGGATSAAAPISPAPSSAATASCRRCRARCNAA